MLEIIRKGSCLSRYYNYFSFGFDGLLRQEQTNINQIRTLKRKGYRERAKKKKVKVVIQKQAWIPHNLRTKDEEVTQKRFAEYLKYPAEDDVWIGKYHSWRIYDFKEAIECHRETLHPTVYNVPDAQINLFIETDMRTARPTKFAEKFRRMAILPHIFEQEGLQERSVLVFCKTVEQKEEARNAGADLVGGSEIIKEIERGKIVLPDFNFIIAHPSILPEMISLRGLLKKRFPNVKQGTLGPNIGELVVQFKNGLDYKCIRDEKQLDYGWIETTCGRLNMETLKLEENFKALLADINTHKPKRPGPFITRIMMTCPPSREGFKIDLTPYQLEEEEDKGDSSDEDEVVPVSL